MSIIKCKMCGGNLQIIPGAHTVTCEYCDTLQTLPHLTDERFERLYDRAGHFRRNHEFDKAMGIFEQILEENPTDAECYWSIILCRYGIEYVEDPQTHKRIPTVNRTQYTSIYDDENYKSALQYADFSQKILYEEEAKVINDIQKGILDISSKEEPFDVFICYKETDESGRRTHDSVYANEIYHELTREGFKVFYARITLEDKLGTSYEPYIFAALHSARVMVVLGTKPEYFNAVWVKNEWSRFLYQIKSGERKTLIPAYKDMDAYDLPEEFAHLQAQDMNKLGFVPDLIRGIRKILGTDGARIPAPSKPVQPEPIQVNTRYDVYLAPFGNRKLESIRACRECFGWGLTEAKNAVESPSRLLVKQVDFQEANRIERFFGDQGLHVELQGCAQAGASVSRDLTSSGNDVQLILKRIKIFLEGKDFSSANAYCERALDLDPENGQAYVYKLMAQFNVNREEDLGNGSRPFDSVNSFVNALRFADEKTAERLSGYNRQVKENLRRIEEAKAEEERQKKEKRDKEFSDVKELMDLSLEYAKKRPPYGYEKEYREKIAQNVGIKNTCESRIAMLQRGMNNNENRKWAVACIVLWLLAVLSLVYIFLTVGGVLPYVENISVSIVAILVPVCILYFIFGGVLFYKDDKPILLLWFNLFYGLPTFIFAIYILKKYPKTNVAKAKKEIKAEEEHMEELAKKNAEIQKEIDTLAAIDKENERISVQYNQQAEAKMKEYGIRDTDMTYYLQAIREQSGA